MLLLLSSHLFYTFAFVPRWNWLKVWRKSPQCKNLQKNMKDKTAGRKRTTKLQVIRRVNLNIRVSWAKTNWGKFTFNSFFIFQHLKTVYMDVNHFCCLYFLKLFVRNILQSLQESRFPCTCTSHYNASNLTNGQISFTEKLSKLLFI